MRARASDSFGARLATLRRARGMSQEQLADRAGVSTQIVSAYELGARMPLWSTVQWISAALDCTLEELRGF